MKLLHIRNNIFLNLRSNSASENLNGAFVQALRWVLLFFCRQIHEKRKTGHLWDAPHFKAQRPSWSSLLRCLCCGRVIWHQALNKWWHTQSRLKCGVWENLFLLNMKRWACLHQKLFTWRSTHSRRFSESELLFCEFWPLSLIIYILYSQEISKFDPDVRCLCVSEFLLLPNKKTSYCIK